MLQATLALSMVPALMVALPHGAQAGEKPACPAEQATEKAALAAAYTCGGQVRVVAATTETSVTWANADGTFSTQMDAGPVRFQQDGKWIDIDVDLEQQPDGTISAQAHPDGIDLFGGETLTARSTAVADRPLITADAAGPAAAGEDAKTISLAWKGALPKPALDGDTATYAEAKPGMDVVVKLTATGFQQHTILKARPTTAVSVTLPIKLDGLTAQRTKDGAVQFIDARGAVTGTMPAPSMWDSRLDTVSQLPTHLLPVTYQLTTKPYGVDVTLTPDMAFLTDPAVQYPVTVDPDVSFNTTFDTWVRRNTTTDNSASTELFVGTDNSGNPARTFLNWDPAPIRGKKIVEAHLGLMNTYSATCATRAVNVHSAALSSTSTRWTSQPTITYPAAAATVGRKACPSEKDPGYISTPPHALDALIQTWADSPSGQRGLALLAPSETDVTYFKGFNSSDAHMGKPYIYITYTTIPRTAECQNGVEGDFNGDGTRDTVLADPDASVGDVVGAGAVHVVNGKTSAVTTLRQGSAGVDDVPEAGDRFGASLAVYDTNLDGCTDLAVGAPFEDIGAAADAGSVTIIYGAPGGLGTGRASVLIQQGRTLTEGRGTVPDAPEAGDWFGHALTAGKTGIGEPYLVVGAPGEDVNGIVDAGKVHYLRDTLNIVLETSAVPGARTAGPDDRSGFALASTPGHVAIGQPGATSADGDRFAGSVCLFNHFYHSNLPYGITCINQDRDDSKAGDAFGKSVAMAAHWPAGTSILAVGVPGEDASPGLTDTGMVHQFQVSDTAVTHLIAVDQDSPGIADSSEAGDLFGEKVLLVNTNPTAAPTAQTLLLAVGAPGEDSEDNVLDYGAVHVFAADKAAPPTDAVIERVAGRLPGAPTQHELIGFAAGATTTDLYVASPYTGRTVWALPWSSLAAGQVAAARTWQAGTAGLPAGAVAFGEQVG